MESLKDLLEIHEENIQLKKQVKVLLELINRIKHYQPKMVDIHLKEAGLDV